MSKDPVFILAVEDESVSQMVLKMFLGGRSKVVGTGSEALDTIERHHEDIKVIFMDLGLPDMNGLSVARQIRKFEAKNDLEPIYICALTSYNDTQKKSECLAAGMNDFLSKPVSMEEMSRIIQRH